MDVLLVMTTEQFIAMRGCRRRELLWSEGELVQDVFVGHGDTISLRCRRVVDQLRSYLFFGLTVDDVVLLIPRSLRERALRAWRVRSCSYVRACVF